MDLSDEASSPLKEARHEYSRATGWAREMQRGRWRCLEGADPVRGADVA